MNPKAYYIFGAYSKVRFAAVSGPFGMHKYIAAGSEGAFQAHLCGLPSLHLGRTEKGSFKGFYTGSFKGLYKGLGFIRGSTVSGFRL